MVRSILFTLCLIVVSSLAENRNTNMHASVVVVDDINEYLAQHPEVKLLQELEKFVAPNSVTPFNKVTYRIGARADGKCGPEM